MKVCKCNKGYASEYDNLCKFCREDMFCSTRREMNIYGLKRRGEGLSLHTFLEVSKKQKNKIINSF